MTRIQAHAGYKRIMAGAQKEGCYKAVVRWLCLNDLFFLLVYMLHRQDVDRDFLFDRCREVQEDSDDVLDVWFREGYKSTIKTFGRKIQRILRDPESRHVIFSLTRPIAKGFLRQIKIEFETNEALKGVFDDILWSNPKKDAPKWSEDDGLIVKRKTNPKEATLEAWGLVDAMPTSKHFTDPDYDDVVDERNSKNPEMNKKAADAVRLSLNLGTTPCHRTFQGTRYHPNDAYSILIADKIVQRVRIWVPTKDKTPEGEPWLWTREQLAEKIRGMGPYISACQLWQDPVQDSLQGFKREWLRFWPANRFQGLNLYILCDPAGEKKKENDYTVFIVIGLGSDRNYYVLDIIRDRMNLVERANHLFALHQQYQPRAVGYEKYGMQSDIEHYKDRMQRDNYRFGITELGGPMPKLDRIKRLVPLFNDGRIYLPENCVHQQYDGASVDIVRAFVDEEYTPFPYPYHDDILDCLARIVDPDLNAVFPQGKEIDPLQLERPPEQQYDPMRYGF